jgi:aminopeptidase N
MSVAEITSAETAERARLLQVESYEVELDLTTGTDVFRSRARQRDPARALGS